MYIFITNPNARSGLGHKIWDDIETVLKKRGVAYQVYFTKYQQHATKIVRQITSDHERHNIIVLGGDGTVNEVSTALTAWQTLRWAIFRSVQATILLGA